MKPALRLSLLANLTLAALLWRQASRTHGESSAPRPTLTGVGKQITNQPAPALQLVLTRDFDWRQIEAPDYATYIASLRAIHCPEQTVRDIITADVASLFARQRKELALLGATTEGGRWSPAEEARLLATLLGGTGSQLGTAPSVQLDPGHPAGSKVQDAQPVRMPLVFQTQALARLNLDEEQRQEIAELEQQFVQEIGGTDQNPGDPAYLAKWLEAQPKADSMIVNVIGRRALVDLDEAIPAPADGTE